jgi:two-component system response regulator YesN
MYRLILVDDEPWALLGIKSCYPWQQNGYQIIFETMDPYVALEQIILQKPDVVFTDIRMYGLSGLELIKKVKEADVNTEFIITSGYNDFKYAKEAIEYGVFHYLLKPLEKHEVYLMMEKLTKHLDKKADFLNKQSPCSNRQENIGEAVNPPGEEKTTFTSIMKYINACYTENLSLSDLAGKFYLHNTYLSDLIKKNLGITFSEYLTDLRLKKACSLLATTSHPISEISAMSGYRDYSYFSKVFRERFSMTPAQYRKNNVLA